MAKNGYNEIRRAIDGGEDQFEIPIGQKKRVPGVSVDEVLNTNLGAQQEPGFVVSSALERGDITTARAQADRFQQRLDASVEKVEGGREYQHQRRSSFKSRSKNFMVDMIGQGVDKNVAAKLTVDQIMGHDQQHKNNRPINTAGGLYDPTSGKIVEGTGAPAKTSDKIPDERFTTYVGSPVVQKDGFLYTWNPGEGYGNPKPIEQGVDLGELDPQMRAVMVAMGKGGKFDYSKIPTLGAPAGAADGAYSGEDIAAVMAENPGYDEAKAARYLKSIGR